MGGVDGTGVPTTVDDGDGEDGEGAVNEGDSKMTLWNAGECADPLWVDAPDPLDARGGLKEGESTIIPGMARWGCAGGGREELEMERDVASRGKGWLEDELAASSAWLSLPAYNFGDDRSVIVSGVCGADPSSGDSCPELEGGSPSESLNLDTFDGFGTWAVSGDTSAGAGVSVAEL